MRTFNDHQEIKPLLIEKAGVFKVGNLIYKHIYIKGEKARCFYCEEERHLIKVTKLHIEAQYAILNKVLNSDYTYTLKFEGVTV
jgi:hypothetical protein